jgi:predicted nucleic acid-binding protein
MSIAVLLDSGPLGLLSNPRRAPDPVACRQWMAAMESAGRRLIVPEIADYEIRRELLRGNKTRGLALLDSLGQKLEYLELTKRIMRVAAELWAQVRKQGRPTAPDDALDGDVILAAQALSLGVPVIVATSNISHIARFVQADLWQNIQP